MERYAATNFTVLTSVAETVDAHGVRIAVAEFDVYHLQLYLAKNASLVKGLTSTSTNHAARIAFAESNVTDHAGRIDSLEEGVSKVWSSIVFLEDGFENLTAELNSLVAAADAPQPDDGTATAIAANISLLQVWTFVCGFNFCFWQRCDRQRMQVLCRPSLLRPPVVSGSN